MTANCATNKIASSGSGKGVGFSGIVRVEEGKERRVEALVDGQETLIIPEPPQSSNPLPPFPLVEAFAFSTHSQLTTHAGLKTKISLKTSYVNNFNMWNYPLFAATRILRVYFTLSLLNIHSHIHE